ncbi:MAG: hypothetical protein IJ493_08220 [Clostridia bacterium]|nr:hypothetical protein [Clostridia bacterium]
MDRINQRSIRRESLRAVYEVIARGGTVSRAQIAGETGYSLMTVGKMVDALEAGGLIAQTKEAGQGTAGRRSSVCCPNPSCGMLVIRPDTTSAEVWDVTLRQRHRCVLPEDIAADMLAPTAFVDAASAYDGELRGTVCVAPADFSPAEYGIRPDLLVTPEVACAAANAYQFDAGLVFCLIVGGDVRGVVMRDGQPVRGTFGRAGDVGALCDPSKPLDLNLLHILEAVCRVLDPEAIHLQCADSLYAGLTDLPGRLAERLEPPVLRVEAESGCPGAFYGGALLMRERWLMDL